MDSDKVYELDSDRVYADHLDASEGRLEKIRAEKRRASERRKSRKRNSRIEESGESGADYGRQSDSEEEDEKYVVETGTDYSRRRLEGDDDDVDDATEDATDREDGLDELAAELESAEVEFEVEAGSDEEELDDSLVAELRADLQGEVVKDVGSDDEDLSDEQEEGEGENQSWETDDEKDDGSSNARANQETDDPQSASTSDLPPESAKPLMTKGEEVGLSVMELMEMGIVEDPKQRSPSGEKPPQRYLYLAAGSFLLAFLIAVVIVILNFTIR